MHPDISLPETNPQGRRQAEDEPVERGCEITAQGREDRRDVGVTQQLEANDVDLIVEICDR